MTRRVMLMLAILAVIAIVVGGTWYYRRQGSPEKMIARIRLEKKASDFEKALRLADDFIAKYGDDWRGYYEKAGVYMDMGRFEDARGPLTMLLEKPELGAKPNVVTLRLSESYSFEAMRKAASPTASQATLLDAVEQIGKANDLLVALILLGDPNLAPMTLKINSLVSSFGTNYQVLTSAAFVSMALPLFIFFALQRYFVQGILSGAVKG